MKYEQMQTLLVNLLDCGYADLRVLEDCTIDFDEILDELKEMGIDSPDLNNLAYAMFFVAKRNMQYSIEERIENLESELDSINEEDTFEFEQVTEELNALKQLDAIEDIESFHNYLDTHVYFSTFAEDAEKVEYYKKYCQKELEVFEEETGYSID